MNTPLRVARRRPVAALFALALVFALVPVAFAAAGCGDSKHPSGKDRCDTETSEPQGKATSDPDDNGNPPERSNGGADKPGGDSEGNEQDRDGNNGCGNDQDFEDDNEGLCLGPSDSEPEGVAAKNNKKNNKVKNKQVTSKKAVKSNVAAKKQRQSRDDDAALATAPKRHDGGVLGIAGEASYPKADTPRRDAAVRVSRSSVRSAAGAVAPAEELPATGAGVPLIVALALAFLLLGTVLVRSAHRGSAAR